MSKIFTLALSLFITTKALATTNPYLQCSGAKVVCSGRIYTYDITLNWPSGGGTIVSIDSRDFKTINGPTRTVVGTSAVKWSYQIQWDKPLTPTLQSGFVINSRNMDGSYTVYQDTYQVTINSFTTDPNPSITISGPTLISVNNILLNNGWYGSGTYNVLGAPSGSSFSWSTSNTSVFSISNITAQGSAVLSSTGKYTNSTTLTATANLNGCVLTASMGVTSIPKSVYFPPLRSASSNNISSNRAGANVDIGIPDHDNNKYSACDQENMLRIFPNPADSDLCIALSDGITDQVGDLNIIIFDMQSKPVKKSKTRDQNPIKIDVASLPSGIYIIKVADSNSGKTYSTKFLKK